MKYLLLTNTAFCFLLAAVMVFMPQLVVHSPNPEAATAALSRAFGFAVVCVGFLSMFLDRLLQNRQALLMGLFVLCVFHVGLTLTHLANSLQQVVPQVLPFIHLLFSIAFIRFVLREIKNQ